MKDKLKLGLIGFGARGTSLLNEVLIPMAKDEKDVELCGVCDFYEDRAAAAAERVETELGAKPFCTTDYKEIIKLDIDAVIIMSAWESHAEIAVNAMEAGLPVGMEVGGINSIEDCWRLVHTSEKTGMPCMLLENCCYGCRELMVLNMVKKGVFGDVVFCEGGYHHDLRYEVSHGEENRHYRLRNYIHRNCENYPTHEIGPIAKILNINNGNRFLTLTSMASSAKGLHDYVVTRNGGEHKLVNVDFKQADIVKTTIKCAGGELVSITLDTTLPHFYSRGFTVRGTRAAFYEDIDAVQIDDKDSKVEFYRPTLYENAESHREKYDHPLWRHYEAKGGHGGMDYLVFRAFVESVKAGVQTPIDVYDTAAWMCISALSEQSIAMGGAPQAFPDFTNGKWMNRTDISETRYRLDKVEE